MSKKKRAALMRAALIALLALTLMGPGVAIQAQEIEEPAATPAPTPTPEPTPIPAREIPDRAADIGPMLRKAIASTDVGDEIERVGSWDQGADVSALQGSPVRLRFVLQDADLYALRFAP